MNVYLAGETEVQLSQMGSDDFNVTKKNEALYYGAIAMWVTSLGRCTYAVLDHYALRLDLDPDVITEKLTWDFSFDPTTIEKIQLTITWPGLPENRRKAVERASHQCTIHTTIKECVDITVKVITE